MNAIAEQLSTCTVCTAGELEESAGSARPMPAEVFDRARLRVHDASLPYSMGELAYRWECSERDAKARVGCRHVKIGLRRFVRPNVLLELEQRKERR